MLSKRTIGVEQVCSIHRGNRLTVRAVTPRQGQLQATKRAVVIGGGWAGYGSAKSLLAAGVEEVVVLDASQNPGGLASTSTNGTTIIEPGIKGFWAQYANIYQLVDELCIPDPFTDWTASAFYSPQGLEVKAPILGLQPRLPTPLGSFIYTNPYFTRLPIQDRLTALPLISALLEYNLDEATYSKYDAMSAYELFRSAGISQRLFEFLESMLLVILFAPSVALSAAASLDALYFFALAHQQDFDVRWCKGPVGATLLQPLMESTRQKGCTIMTGRRATHVMAEGSGQSTMYRIATTNASGQVEEWAADAVVLAVGVKALQGIVQKSPLLASIPTFAGLMNLGIIDAIAVRLWLDRRIVPESPSNVLAGFERNVGATFFDLNALQDQYRDEENSVLEVDFYGASSLLPMTDDQLVERIMNHYLPTANTAYAAATVLNRSVVRVQGGVTAFSPGSHHYLPPVVTSLPGVFCAGDCVRQGPGSHGAKGLCQEKAYATGLQAGNAAAEFLGFTPYTPVLEPEEDEQHIRAAREAIKTLRDAATMLPGLPLPTLPKPLEMIKQRRRS